MIFDDVIGTMKKKLLPYLQLCRAPALFSAWADILVSARIARDDWPPATVLLWLFVATSGLYLSGMVFNDIADFREDLAERPNRPLPSGRVSKRTAWFLAIGLLLIGNLAAWQLRPETGWCALVLSAVILIYDFGPRGTFAAFALMGICRGLNLLLGISTGTLPLTWIPFSAIATWVGAYVLYIFGVTWFASHETGTGRRQFLWGGIASVNLAIFTWCLAILYFPQSLIRWIAVALLLAVLWRLDLRLWKIARDPAPANVQGGVRMLLMSIIPLHAVWMLAITENFGLALIVLVLMIPARLLGRWMTIS